MLILFREVGEKIIIGDDIQLTVSNVIDDRVVIEVNGPEALSVCEEEQYNRDKTILDSEK